MSDDEYTPTTENLIEAFAYWAGFSEAQARKMVSRYDAEVRADQREKDAQIAARYDYHVATDDICQDCAYTAAAEIAAEIREGRDDD